MLTAAASDLSRPLDGGGQAGLAHGAAEPLPGDPACGHGLTGRVARRRDRQPLSTDGVWRVSLEGEGSVVRLVRRSAEQNWQLLQIDDLTDEQLEAYERGMKRHPTPTSSSLLPTPR